MMGPYAPNFVAVNTTTRADMPAIKIDCQHAYGAEARDFSISPFLEALISRISHFYHARPRSTSRARRARSEARRFRLFRGHRISATLFAGVPLRRRVMAFAFLMHISRLMRCDDAIFQKSTFFMMQMPRSYPTIYGRQCRILSDTPRGHT